MTTAPVMLKSSSFASSNPGFLFILGFRVFSLILVRLLAVLTSLLLYPAIRVLIWSLVVQKGRLYELLSGLRIRIVLFDA